VVWLLLLLLLWGLRLTWGLQLLPVMVLSPATEHWQSHAVLQLLLLFLRLLLQL
jgi:hypothetical protein